MALIPCPECLKSISDKAYSCPQCGFPLASNMSVNPRKISNMSESLYQELSQIIQDYIFVPESDFNFNKEILLDKLEKVLENHEETSKLYINMLIINMEPLCQTWYKRAYNTPEKILENLQEVTRKCEMLDPRDMR